MAKTLTSMPLRHRTDPQCRADATEYLVGLIGSPPDDLSWDCDHHLQGHAHVCGCELVLIAARDEAHHPLVLTARDWDEIRRAFGDERRDMLRACAIESHDRLTEVLKAS
jgi:hypothetical protein